MKTKKRRLQKDAEALEKEADDLAVTAEQSMISHALQSPTVCIRLQSRNWLTFRQLTSSWKVSSSSPGTNDTSAAIELM